MPDVCQADTLFPSRESQRSAVAWRRPWGSDERLRGADESTVVPVKGILGMPNARTRFRDVTLREPWPQGGVLSWLRSGVACSGQALQTASKPAHHWLAESAVQHHSDVLQRCHVT